MIPCQRHLFEIPDNVAYFNCASMSPNLKAVRAAGEAGVARKSKPWAIHLVDFFDEVDVARDLFARLIGARADDIAIVPAASYGVATAAANLPAAAGRRIVLLESQHPSNVFTWLELCRRTGAEVAVVPRPEDDDWTRAVLDAIDDRAAIVALPQCHWTDGTLVDLVKVGARCRDAGAALVLDLTQSAGALPFDVGAVGPDFLVAAGSKWLLCPYALGFLYVAPHRQDGRPLEASVFHREGTEKGRIWRRGVLHHREGWQPGARRFDMGERANIALMPMATTALRQILDWGSADINRSIALFNDSIAKRAAPLGLVAPPPKARSGHLTGLRFPKGAPKGVQERLEALGVHVTMLGDVVRVSPHLWITEADVERLIAGLARVTAAA